MKPRTKLQNGWIFLSQEAKRRKRSRAKHSLKTMHVAMTNKKLQAVLQSRSYMKTNEALETLLLTLWN